MRKSLKRILPLIYIMFPAVINVVCHYVAIWGKENAFDVSFTKLTLMNSFLPALICVIFIVGIFMIQQAMKEFKFYGWIGVITYYLGLVTANAINHCENVFSLEYLGCFDLRAGVCIAICFLVIVVMNIKNLILFRKKRN